MNPPLRVWPGVVAVALQWVLIFVVPKFAPDQLIYCMLAGFVAALAILVWYLFFSRTPLPERIGVLVLMFAAAFLTMRVIDKSIATAMMGFMFPFFSIPTLCLGLVAGAVIGRRMSAGRRRVAMVAAIVLACGAWTLLRTTGISGDGAPSMAFRWSKTHEAMLIAQAASLPPSPASEPAVSLVAKVIPEPVSMAPVPKPSMERPSMPPPKTVAVENTASWPGFRGPNRDGIVSGTSIATDWSASPPVEIWRRPVGPGWSSFAVQGDLLYTQEQRGEDELVSCYNATTGKPVWAHRDAARFWEANAGAGPRATPTLDNGRVYTFGATGIVNALDAHTGSLIWTRNAATDTGIKMPGWAFASSPLVYKDTLIVAASGKLIAYDLSTGAPRWMGPTGGDSYSSPHLATIDGVQQILLLSAPGVSSVAPADGKLLWKYDWHSDTRIMQPAILDGGEFLMSSGDANGGVGLRRVAVVLGPAEWTTQERWTSPGLKPSFNDFVAHDGHVYGFDGGILACIDLNEGKRNWKGGRFGHGQLVLLRDQSLLVVLSEEGDVALVKAAPDEFTELGKFHALEGKTWNHPVVVGNRLFVRNDNEMAAYQLASKHQ